MTTTTRKTVKRAVPADLIAAIYAAEGWVPVEGERRVARCNALYTLSKDNRTARYIATPKD